MAEMLELSESTYRPYLDIQDYGVIGNLRSVALVGIDGSIDWYCCPKFDSASVFAAILDAQNGGYFQIRTASDASYRQLYLPDTNVLITRFLCEEGVGEITDFMPISLSNGASFRGIVRRVTSVKGDVSFVLRCLPAFDYARATHELLIKSYGAEFRSSNLALRLATTVPLEHVNSGVKATFTLREGTTTSLFLNETSEVHLPNEDEALKMFRDTVTYWRKWLSKCQYQGRWSNFVNRSALTLKLMTFESSGALIAAPTCSLPEVVSGERNWDYRYVWLRDAAFAIYALLRIGFKDEASAFMRYLMARISESSSGQLQPVYGIDGQHTLSEEILFHLEGYRGSKPVRVGNAAAEQLQLDFYGALVDAIYLFNKYVTPVSYDLWVDLTRILNWVCDNWSKPDAGIWEYRTKGKQFVYSKMMCWVAMDRGIRIAMKRGLPCDLHRWRQTRDAIYEDVMNNGWDKEAQSFVQSYGSKTIDASTLLMPLVFFVSPTDPRMLNTLKAIQRELTSDPLVYRYRNEQESDGLKGAEGTFNLCTFWLVEALTRAGRLEEARITFERMLGYANHLGLYSEENGPRGYARGNFPQTFTHFALISAAVNLDRALGASEPS
jgi:GH15 family glucan-1,4-alpha-glucosidase